MRHLLSLLLVALQLQLQLSEANFQYSYENYKEYPDWALPILAETVKELKDLSPQVTMYDTLTARIDDPHDPFSGLKEVAIRNSYQNLLFKLDVQYQLETGLDSGCRVVIGGDNSTTAASVSYAHSDCALECTHHGRYCFPKDIQQASPELQRFTGNALVQEITRRACLGDVLEGKFASFEWFKYLEHFDNNCLEGDLHDCSTQYMENTLELGVHPKFQDCISNLNGDYDQPLLDKMLQHTTYFKNHAQDLPMMVVEGDKIHSSRYRPDFILQDWCAHFPDDINHAPVACDFCSKCDYVGNCLWGLQCDHVQFSLETYKDPKPTPHPTALVTPAPTDPPLATPNPTGAPTKAPTTNTNVDAKEEEEEEEAVSPASASDPKKDEQEQQSSTSTTTEEKETIEEEVVQDTKIILLGGVALGFVMSVACFGLMELKRKRAIQEVRKELPMMGFRDRQTGGATKVESPHVAFT